MNADHKKEDRRKRKAKKLIKKTFSEMLETTPFEKIRIGDLTEACDINRSTFYAHYTDIYDLLGDCVLTGWTFPTEERNTIVSSTKEGVFAKTEECVIANLHHLYNNRNLSLVALRQMNGSPYMKETRNSLIGGIIF